MLTGGTGIDQLLGGDGDDTYIVEQGIDTIRASAGRGRIGVRHIYMRKDGGHCIRAYRVARPVRTLHV